jgi:hypothetical protein
VVKNNDDDDVPSTVVLMHAKSGSASLNARISVGKTKLKSLLGWTKRTFRSGSCRPYLEVGGSQRVEHQNHPDKRRDGQKTKGAIKGREKRRVGG